MPESRGPSVPALTRRTLLASTAAAVGASAVGSVLGPLSGFGVMRAQQVPSTEPSPATGTLVPFDGPNQAGIVTPAQDRLAFAAFDVTSASRGDLADLFRTWTVAARAMTAGRPVGDVGGRGSAPPVDTGEALGLPPAKLTVTFGVGPSLFDSRFGLADRRPSALAELPSFPGDLLESDRSNGDLCIQACSDDPQVSFHAVRNLARLGRGVVTVRWFQLGFGRTSSTSSAQVTPRNLMGFKDGTNNIVAEEADAVSRFVWVGDETDQPWMGGGSYLVARRIRMRIESWDRAALDEQEQIIGRRKVTGAPIGAAAEHDQVDLDASHPSGSPLIPIDAHIRLAAPSTNGGERILRRGYSFTDGIDPRTGELDAGLFFICFQRDPRSGFVAIQQRLAASDSLNEYLRNTGSALFACPPGTGPDGWWGEGLLA